MKNKASKTVKQRAIPESPLQTKDMHRKMRREKSMALEILSSFENAGKGFFSHYAALQCAMQCVAWLIMAEQDEKKIKFWHKVRKELTNL